MKLSIYKRWLLYYAGSLIVLLTLFGGMNYLIDPYGFNRTLLLPSINANKTQTDAQSRKFKLTLAHKKQYNALFLGSSEMTFLGNTSYASDLTGLTFFNLAFNEQELYESYQYLNYITSIRDIQHVILGLHPFKFNKNNKNYRQDKPDNIIKGKGNLETYFAIGTWLDSLKTLYKNLKAYPPIYNSMGFKIINRPEYYGIPKEQHTSWLYHHVHKDPHILKHEAQQFQLDHTKIEYLYDIIDLCLKKGIKLQLLFTPMYVQHYHAIYDTAPHAMKELKRLIAQRSGFYDFSSPNVLNNNYQHFFDRVSHANQQLSYPMIDALISDTYYHDFGLYIKQTSQEP